MTTFRTTRATTLALRGTIAAGLLSTALLGLHVPLVAAAVPTSCGGAQATYLGTDVADSFSGTIGADSISTGTGDDTLGGAAGDDRLCGGDGYDELTGGPGADLLDGGAGPDAAIYYDATGAVTASLMTGTASGGAGTDTLVAIESLYGSDFGDQLTGGAMNEYIGGSGGADRITGGGGADNLAGGDGDDTLLAKDGLADHITCGPGLDMYAADAIDIVAADCEVAIDGNDAVPPANPDPAVQDMSSPTAGVTSPVAGSTVSGAITFSASATDDVAVTSVDLYVDGVLRSSDTAAPWALSIDTRTLANGSHAFAARAHDAAGHVSPTATSQATVANVTVSPTADTDGDGLLDTWEVNGLDANGDGVVDLNLAAMGASPRHKDVFIEVDTMQDVARLRPTSLKLVTEAFRLAPVANPDGLNGITMHIDNGAASIMDPRAGTTWGTRTRQNTIPFTTYTDPGYNFSGVEALRSKYFTDAARRRVFRYGLNVNRHSSPTQGSGGIATIGGDSFIVSIGYTTETSRDVVQGTMFMHEFGHNLGLLHGGTDSINDKPNYLSIMNYSWGWDGLRLAAGGHVLDYSRFDSTAMPTLNEASLNEDAGIRGSAGASKFYGVRYCGSSGYLVKLNTPTDWNCNGAIGGFVARVVRNSGNFASWSPSSAQTLRSSNDWSRIQLGLATNRAKRPVRIVSEPQHHARLQLHR